MVDRPPSKQTMPQATTAFPDLAAALPLIESEPLGQSHVLHNRESGAIVASNAFGALLLDQLRDHPDVETVITIIADILETAPADVAPPVRGTLESWMADGLFLTAPQPFPGARAFRPAEDNAPRWFSTPEGRIRLACEDPALTRDLDRALAPTGLASAPADTDHVALDVVNDGSGYGVFRDQAPIWSLAPYDLTRFHVLREVMDVVCGSRRIGAHLHASAMAKDGGALVFAGASGSGKSTLATLMLGAGCALACDDHVALDKDGTGLFAFPTRPNLKSGSQALPSVQHIIATQSEGPEEFVPRNRVAVGERLRLRGIVLPQYGAESENVVREVSPDEALTLLIQTGSRISRSTKSLAPLAHALRRHPIRALHYRDNAFAVETCLALLSG